MEQLAGGPGRDSVGFIPEHQFAKRFFRRKAGVPQNAGGPKRLVVASSSGYGADAANVAKRMLHATTATRQSFSRYFLCDPLGREPNRTLAEHAGQERSEQHRVAQSSALSKFVFLQSQEAAD